MSFDDDVDDQKKKFLAARLEPEQVILGHRGLCRQAVTGNPEQAPQIRL